MGLIKGDLGAMYLSDLLQWIELCGKAGTVTIRANGIAKRLYFAAGRLIFVSSEKEGERLGEYLHRSSHVDIGRIRTALFEAQTMKIPFTQRLLKMHYFTPSGLKDVIRTHATEILLDAFRWTDGEFEFDPGALPPAVLGGPIKLDMPVGRFLEILEASGSVIQKENVTYYFRIK
ncbi:MAG: DUF4388 domain-containing protein [Nitrospiraceae bacterium]|nr:DUF4388 domain-containing protein [Nitrospiraceae bacterium]